MFTITVDFIQNIDEAKHLSFKLVNDLDKLIGRLVSIGRSYIKYGEDKNNRCVVVEYEDELRVIAEEKFRALQSENWLKLCVGVFAMTKFTSIDLTNVDTSEIEDMSYMFFRCSAHTINMQGMDTSNAKIMNFMFAECQNIEYLDIGGFNTPKLESMISMFKEFRCKTVLRLSGIDTSHVTNMGGLFDSVNVPILDISNINTSKVNSMFCMFSESQIGNLNSQLVYLDTHNVLDMTYMFKGVNCKVIDVGMFDTGKLADCSGMFFGCSAVIKGISNLKNNAIGYMTCMFANFKNLNIKLIDISKFVGDALLDDTIFKDAVIDILDISNSDIKDLRKLRGILGNSYVVKIVANDVDMRGLLEEENVFNYILATEFISNNKQLINLWNTRLV